MGKLACAIRACPCFFHRNFRMEEHNEKNRTISAFEGVFHRKVALGGTETERISREFSSAGISELLSEHPAC